MTDADLVVVHSFGTRQEADVALSALEAAGIDAIVQGDTAGGQYPAVVNLRGFRITVRAEDAPAARDILNLRARTENREPRT
jgi:hypothetical protein